jgi:hypothetical protein
MQNHETNGNSDDISSAKLRQLILAITLLKKMMQKKKEPKLMMVATNPHSYYRDICHPFSNN